MQKVVTQVFKSDFIIVGAMWWPNLEQVDSFGSRNQHHENVHPHNARIISNNRAERHGHGSDYGCHGWSHSCSI